MRPQTWTMLWLATIAGCASAPETPNPWTDLERADPAVTYPAELPLLAEDLSNLDVVLDVALENSEIAAANADALAAMSRAHNALIDAGASEHELGQLRRRLLEEERRARLWDRLSVMSIVALLGLGSL